MLAAAEAGHLVPAHPLQAGHQLVLPVPEPEVSRSARGGVALLVLPRRAGARSTRPRRHRRGPATTSCCVPRPPGRTSVSVPSARRRCRTSSRRFTVIVRFMSVRMNCLDVGEQRPGLGRREEVALARSRVRKSSSTGAQRPPRRPRGRRGDAPVDRSHPARGATAACGVGVEHLGRAGRASCWAASGVRSRLLGAAGSRRPPSPGCSTPNVRSKKYFEYSPWASARLKLPAGSFTVARC